MAQRKTTKIVSKKHLARLERERRQSRLIVTISAVILAVILLSIVYGILNETVLQNYRTIATVNGENVTVREFVARAKATREQLVDQYVYYYQLASMFGIDPSQDTQLSQLFYDIQIQLDYPENLANQVLTYIEDDLMLKQYALQNGITVTPEDVENEIQATYKYFPAGTQTPTLTATLLAFSTLSPLQLDLVTATPTTLPTSVPTAGPTLTATVPAPTATTAPSPTPVTEEGFQQSYQEALDHYRSLGFSEELFRTIYFENTLYRQRVKAVVTADVPHETEQVWARHILVADIFTARSVVVLLKNDVDFASAAATYSTDTGSKDNGGDLGWFGRGQMVPEFEEVAFSLPVGEVSGPIRSQYGYHIIQVLGHEMRPLTPQEYDTAVDDAFTAFLNGLRSEAAIQVSPDFLSYIPEKPTLQDAFTDMFNTQTALAPTQEAQQEATNAALALTPSSTPPPPTATP